MDSKGFNSVRKAVLAWQPRKTTSMIEFISIWNSQVTERVWDNVLNQLIFPKLTREVERWDPYRDQAMYHND